MTKSWAIAVLCAVFFAAGCSDEEEVLPAQQERIVSYLTGAHDPRLVTEQEAGESLEIDVPYYSTFGNTAYRYIRDVYDEERLARTEVAWGDELTLTYSSYVFEGRAPSKEACFASNDAAVLEELIGDGLNPQLWVETDPVTGEPLRDPETQALIPFEKRVRVGGDLLDGLSPALAGCREGDYVEIYLTYNLAYGDKEIVGLVPKQSPVLFVCTIDRVTKP